MKMREKIILIVLLAVVASPFVMKRFGKMNGFVGTDNQAQSMIGRIRPDYRPWFTSIFDPGEKEEWLFALQATIFSVALEGGGLRIALALNSAAIATGLVVRSLAATSCLCLLLLTTPINEIVSILRRCGLLSVICELMLAVHRFIYIFAETAASIWLAQTARCGYASKRNAYRSISRLVAALFIHSIERAGRMEIGISARGYEGNVRWIEPARALSVKALCGIALLEIGVVTLSLSFNGGWRH